MNTSLQSIYWNFVKISGLYSPAEIFRFISREVLARSGVPLQHKLKHSSPSNSKLAAVLFIECFAMANILVSLPLRGRGREIGVVTLALVTHQPALLTYA